MRTDGAIHRSMDFENFSGGLHWNSGVHLSSPYYFYRHCLGRRIGQKGLRKNCKGLVLVLRCITTFLYDNVWHASVLECSADDKASLTAIGTSRTEEARMVERARIILTSRKEKRYNK